MEEKVRERGKGWEVKEDKEGADIEEESRN